MSDELTAEELAQWTAFRNREADIARKEIFTEPEQDIQLSEIKERLAKLAKHGCLCHTCVALFVIIEAIEKAERRCGK